jgi:hypothetical protein
MRERNHDTAGVLFFIAIAVFAVTMVLGLVAAKKITQ